MFPFDAYFDKNGLLVKITQPYPEDGDGTNTAQDTALYRFGKYLKNIDNPKELDREAARYNQEMDMLEHPLLPNYYLSHPDQGSNDPKAFSTYHLLSLIITAGVYGLKSRLLGILLAQFKRLGRYQNKQFFSLAHTGIWLRALYLSGYKFSAVLYPLLILTDALYFLHVAFFHTNFELTLMSLLQSRLALTTPFSLLLDKNTDWDAVQEVLKRRYAIEKGHPPMYESLYKDVLKETK